MPVKKTTTAAGNGKSKSLESEFWHIFETGAPNAGIQPIGDSALPNPAGKPQSMHQGQDKLVRFVAHAT